MKALSLDSPLNWKRIDIAEPATPGPTEAIVRVHQCRNLWNDLSGYLGKMPFFSYREFGPWNSELKVVAVGSEDG